MFTRFIWTNRTILWKNYKQAIRDRRVVSVRRRRSIHLLPGIPREPLPHTFQQKPLSVYPPEHPQVKKIFCGKIQPRGIFQCSGGVRFYGSIRSRTHNQIGNADRDHAQHNFAGENQPYLPFSAVTFQNGGSTSNGRIRVQFQPSDSG